MRRSAIRVGGRRRNRSSVRGRRRRRGRTVGLRRRRPVRVGRRTEDGGWRAVGARRRSVPGRRRLGWRSAVRRRGRLRRSPVRRGGRRLGRPVFAGGDGYGRPRWHSVRRGGWLEVVGREWRRPVRVFGRRWRCPVGGLRRPVVGLGWRAVVGLGGWTVGRLRSGLGRRSVRRLGWAVGLLGRPVGLLGRRTVVWSRLGRSRWIEVQRWLTTNAYGYVLLVG